MVEENLNEHMVEVKQEPLTNEKSNSEEKIMITNSSRSEIKKSETEMDFRSLKYLPNILSKSVDEFLYPHSNEPTDDEPFRNVWFF